jgi:two-component system cell cycle response regulator DivK
MLVRRILTAENYKLLEATNAVQAINLLETTTPDLILMDINMPDMDGYTLTTRIRSMPGLVRIPILALTANVMRGDKEKTLEAGCDGYIQKPLDVDQLIREIEKFLARRANV